MRRIRSAVLVFGVALLAACEAVAPALTQLVAAFGQDLIAAASVNHAPRYAQQVEGLLLALAHQTTGLQLQSTLAQVGYQPPPPKYMQRQYQNQGYDQGYDQSYGETGDPYGQNGAYGTDPYADDPYANDPYANDAYANDPYADVPNAGAQDPYAQPQDSYTPYPDPYAGSEQPMPGQLRSTVPIELEASILVQRAGTRTLTAIDDGASLRDGGANPAAGDLLKIHFRVSCACFVYVIGVDATGYVAQIFPDGHANPVAPQTAYLIPAGQQDWWALDAYKGVEQVFFVASYTRRDDIEQRLREMVQQPRGAPASNYQAVTQAAFVPATRGLVKVSGGPVAVSGPAGPQTITPSLFAAREPSGEVVVTRWFNHE